MSRDDGNTAAVMAAIGRKSIIDQLLEAFRTAGVSVRIRTRALDVPMMGVLVDLGMKGCLRTDAVPPVSRVLAATDEEKGVCTVALYAFYEADQYSESCMVWGNAVALYSPTPDMENRRRKTDGRGTVIPICPRTPMPSIGEMALGDKGLCLRALRNEFQVWTGDDSKAWVVPGTKGLSRIPKVVMQEIMDRKEGPSPMKRIAGTI